MEFLTNYWFMISSIIFIVGVFLFVFFTIRRSERNRKKWFKTANVGDICNVSAVGSNYLNDVEIIDIDDDIVTVKVKVRKSWVYPTGQSKRNIK